MKRIAKTMKLKPGFEDEYRLRHDALWPDMARVLKEAGISDYSIFLDAPSLTLFAVHKAQDTARVEALAESKVVQRWWAYMADIMETNPDNSPVSTALTEVFHLD